MNSAANDNRIESTVTAVNGVITHRNVRGRDYKRFGHTYQGPIAAGHHVAITPGKSVVLWGITKSYDGKTGKLVLKPYRVAFAIGDTAVHGSYNLVYTGTIVAIGEKTITVDDNGRKHRMSIYDFNSFNSDFDLTAISKRNSEWMD